MASRVRDRTRDGVTTLLGAWLVAGLFVDGYMHNTRGGELESFLTPWHGLLYSGFAASAVWIAHPLFRTEGPVRARLAALPDGHALGALGVLVFAIGGIADSVWHTLFGIEVDLEALLSPPHLLLFAGAMLILTTPARAAWRRAEQPPTLRAFLPALGSVTLATLLVGFFLMYASGLYDFHATASFYGEFEPGGMLEDTPFLRDVLIAFGVLARLVTTVLLMVPTLLIVRRWSPPPGTFTVLFTTYAAFMLVLEAFSRPELVLAGLATGLVADVLVARLRPGVERPVALHAFAAAVPAALWLTHLGLLALTGNLGWPFAIWGGLVLFAAGTGYVLALLTCPPVGAVRDRPAPSGQQRGDLGFEAPDLVDDLPDRA